jgi:catechol 2,3-dioxygenase-like lactoylglutathione lyase family enzyme
MSRPEGSISLRHVALRVRALEACEQFYTHIIGMCVEWRPDADNVYLTSGHDNLALHRVTADLGPDDRQRLDHIGFIVQRSEQVDDWFTFLTANNVPIVNPPRTHRDGARSLYCRDPDGNTVQLIYHPPLSGLT